MILVTGGTGLVGSHLLRYLITNKPNISIRAIKRPSSRTNLVADIYDQIEWRDVDLLDVTGLKEAMQGVNQVYHSAAMIAFIPSKTEQMHQINVEGTANIVNVCLETGVDKLVYVSSVAAIGRTKSTENVVIDEHTKWEDCQLNSQYAISKYRAEQEVWRGNAEGLNIVIVNPSMILGRGDWSKGSSRVFSMIADGLKFCPKGGNGFVDVLDVVRVMVLLMDDDTTGERFILAPHNRLFRELFALIAKELNKPAPMWTPPDFLSGLAWRIEAIKSWLLNKEPIITKETVMTAQHVFRYNSEKIKQQLSFQFTPLEKTISRVATEFLADHS